MLDLPKFLEHLKKLGFKVSMSEVIDSNRMLLEAESLLELRFGLRMILSKSKQEQDLFDLVWDYMIQPEIDKNSQTHEKEEEEASESQSKADNMSGLPLEAAAFGRDGSNALAVSLSRSGSAYKGIVRQLLGGNVRNAGAIMLRYMLAQAMDVEDLRNRQANIRKGVQEMLEDLYNDPELQTLIPDDPENYLEALDHSLQQIMQEHLANPPNIRRNPLKIEDIQEIPLIGLKPSAELQHALRILGKKLATRHKRKQRAGERKINLRRTIRKNIQHGGVLLELEKQRPRLNKPKLLLVTDVSPSTIQATRMFLSIIWNAREVFSDIQYFEFIGSCIDVTGEFRRAKTVDDGIESSLKRWNREIGGKENSDYYSAFRLLEKKTQDRLSKRVSIVILGDLRDWLGPWRDGQPMSVEVLGRLRKKVNRIIVLNPETKRLWDTGDSICKYSTEEGLEVYETTNLGQLIQCLLDVT
ncbi:MAG: VWA domain-containing protein [Candidatus Kariarchaeaceae archaeon]|jgi:uncharacterized protein with von Willebrand factor type A (vWA) domain